MSSSKKPQAAGSLIAGKSPIYNPPPEEGLEVEVELSDMIILKAPRGEYRIRYTCTNPWNCGAEFEIYSLGISPMECAACGAEMKATARRIEE